MTDPAVTPAPLIAVFLEVTDDLTAAHLRSFVALLDRLGVSGEIPLVSSTGSKEITLGAWAQIDYLPSP